MRIVIADPPAYTPWYDHELAGALARAGADVELATSHFPLRGAASAGWVRARRALLSAVVAPVPALAGTAAAEGGRAPRGGALARAGPSRRPASAVARRAADRRQDQLQEPCGLHRARPAAPPHGRQARALEAAAREVRPRRRAHRARPRGARRARDRAGRDLASGVSEQRRARRRRPDDPGTRGDPSLQGARGRGRGRRAAHRILGCSSPATRRWSSASCATRRGPNGGSAT